jgi:hypothetical protein
VTDTRRVRVNARSGAALIKESVTSFRGASLANIAASQSIKLAE